MTKNKNLLIFRMLLIGLIFLTIGACKSLTLNKNIELIKAIPNSVSFIIKTNDIQKLDSTILGLKYRDVLIEYSWLNTLKANHMALSSVLSKVAKTDSSYVFPLVASLHLSNATSLNSIHYFPLDLSKKAFEKLIDENFASTSTQAWKYQNTTVTEILMTSLEQKITVAYIDNILVISPVSFLVEDAIKQLNSSNGLLSDNSFKKVYNKESNAADLNIWFKFENMKKWISTFSTISGTETLSHFKNFAEWSLMDVYFNEEGVFMSGITATNSANKLAAFSEQSVCNHTNGHILPVNTAIESHYSQIPDSIKSLANKANIKNCWTKVLIEPLKTEDVKDWVLTYELKSNDKLKEENINALEAIGKKMLHTDKVYSKQYENYYLISKKNSLLQNYYNSVSAGQVLSKDEGFNSLHKNLKADANVNFYIRSAYTKEALKSIYRDNVNFSNDFEKLRGFNQAAFQFSKSGEKYLTTAHFSYAAHDISSHTNIVWKTVLDKSLIAGPQIITIDNHQNKGVLVQDEDYTLYLLSQGGDIIWRKSLDSEWLGDAHILKLYNDNSIQITFNTQLNWYLVDEDGENIVGFPLKFKEDANTGLTIAKINGKDCAFIGSSNEGIYGYEINGKPLNGWNPKNKVGKLVGGIQPFKANGKLYISALNDRGSVYVWNQKGEKVSSASFKTQFPSPPFVDLKAKPFKLKNVRSNGELVSLNSKNGAGKFKLPVSSVDQFFMANISGNSDPEIIVSNGTRISVFSYTGKKIWSKNVKGTLKLITQNNKKSILSVIDNSDRTITILNEQGKVLSNPDFYVGNLSVTGKLLGNDQIALISNGQDREVICYRISLE